MTTQNKPQGDALGKLSGLRSFLAGYALSESAKRNELGPTIEKWIEGLDYVAAQPPARG